MLEDDAGVAVEQADGVLAGGERAEREGGGGGVAEDVFGPVGVAGAVARAGRFARSGRRGQVKFDGRAVVERDGVAEVVVGVDGEGGEEMQGEGGGGVGRGGDEVVFEPGGILRA